VATWVGGLDGIRHRTAESLLSLLIRARRRVRLFAPFVDEPGLRAIAPGMAAATRRKVHIDVAIREQTRPLVEAVLPPVVASMGDPRMLQMHVLANDEVFPHLKVLSVDGAWAYIGSANLTWAALIHNVELGVLVDGDEVVVLDQLFDQMLLPPSATEADG
jgi:phosphatidylserine/phosphatidylglycerophosphate/cardiolipin synthase-like enzyme